MTSDTTTSMGHHGGDGRSMRDVATKTLHMKRVLARGEGQAGESAEPRDGLPAVSLDPAFVATALPIRVKKRITIPALTIPEGAAAVFRILTAIATSEVADAKYGPARVCQVEAPNGEVRVLILNEVLHAALTKAYAKEGYVGLWFHVVCLPGLREGKRGSYRDYAVTEIEPPTGAGSEAAD